MKKSIKKYKPIFLIEYNVSIFKKIRKILKLYKPFVYDYINDKFLEIDRINKKRISRTSRKNFLTNRNIYFIPINKSLKKLHDNYRN